MKVTFVVKKSVKRYDTDSKATIYLRLRDGRQFDSITPTKLSINPNLWDDKAEQVKSKVVCSDEIRSEINEGVRNLKTYIEKEYQSSKQDDRSKNWLKTTLDKYDNPEKYKSEEELEEEAKPTFEQLFDEFLIKHKLSEVRKKNFKVVKRVLLRYELFVQQTQRGKKDFRLDINTINPDILADLWNYMGEEYRYYDLYPSLYEQIPEKRKPMPRGENTIIDYFCKIRTFMRWCSNDKEITTNKPFEKFSIPEPIYGTPFYITLEERNKIFDLDLSQDTELEVQRDIFIFQSLIGCRIGDLYRMTSKNIINGAVEYIAGKTKDGRPVTVRVPLNNRAKMILNKYEGSKPNLFPFTYEQEYNDSIKEIFRLAGVERLVTILNPTTREEEKVPICDKASSHLARRTFIGNLYKQLKDPNLIGVLSGHKEGSKSFGRYRDIDDNDKQEVVNLLD